MNAWQRLRFEWPAWLCAAFVFMLPWGGRSPLPMAIMALTLLAVAFRAEYRPRLMQVSAFVVPLFLAFWLPILFSLPDSYDGFKTLKMTLGGSRLLMAALAIGIFLQSPALRWRTLQLVCWILAFWSVDAFVQLLAGVDLLGNPLNPERLTALFRRVSAFGPTLAMLSPLALEYARRRWPPWAFAALFALICGAVLIAGMRAGWLMMGLVAAVYVVLLLRFGNHGLRRAAIVFPLALGVAMAVGWFASDTLRERVSRTMALTGGTFGAVDYASSYRLPIFETSWRIYRDHPINGVGVRAFQAAYVEYAAPDDPHVGRGEPALHAHNIVLEAAADSGTIGLLGLLAAYVLGWRRWRAMAPETRQDALPFVMSLALIVFPLNSYFSTYGSYTATITWFLVGLWAACLPPPKSREPEQAAVAEKPVNLAPIA